MKQDVVVVGYPKSGNTWATRLVAEVLGAPSVGFFGAPKQKEVASEGADRESPYQVFKSHHPIQRIRSISKDAKIVGIVRDPRDVTVSGAHYFSLSKYIEACGSEPGLDKFEAMARTICDGGVYSHCTRSWPVAVADILDNDILMLRYEDLLSSPAEELRKTLDYIGTSRSQEAIDEAIENQSFAVAKKRHSGGKGETNRKLMRSGKAGSYADSLSADQISRIEKACGAMMKKLNYA